MKISDITITIQQTNLTSGVLHAICNQLQLTNEEIKYLLSQSWADKLVCNPVQRFSITAGRMLHVYITYPSKYSMEYHYER